MSRFPPDRPPGKPPADWRDWVLVVLVGAHLAVFPWLLGGMALWSQKLSLGMAGLAFVAGLLLRLTDPALPVKTLAKRVLTHPLLWLGLALTAYVTVQALNPAWKYVVIGNMFFMVPLDYVRWLPFGVDAPIEPMNPFRHLLINSAVILTVLTVSLFIHRRKSVRILFILLSLGGLGLAGVGFAQLFLEAEELLWTFRPSHDRFYASFIYRNHAAAYLNIVFTISVGLYFFYRERAWGFRRGATDVSPVFFFTALGIFTLSLFSQSRAGTVIAVALLLLAGLSSLIHGVRWRRLREAALVSGIYTALFAVFVATFIAILGLDRITERFTRLADADADRGMQTRLIGYKATWEMFQASPKWGWGAGSFEYMFPGFQKQYPEIHVNARGERMIWEYAHNDPLQYLAEYGVAGMTLILLFGAYWGWQYARRRIWKRPLLLFAVLAGLSPVLHSAVDFPMQNPAILITAAACFALSSRYLQIEDNRHIPPPAATAPENISAT